MPINSLGDESDPDVAGDASGSENRGAGEEGNGDDDDSEWDPSEERLPGQTSKSAKGKEKAVEGEENGQPWQAVWAAEQNGAP